MGLILEMGEVDPGNGWNLYKDVKLEWIGGESARPFDPPSLFLLYTHIGTIVAYSKSHAIYIPLIS